MRRAADGELHVPQRAARAALRHSGCLRQPFPPRDAGRSESLGTARQGEHSGGDVVSAPHVADDSRQVAARKYSGGARAASAARRQHDAGRSEDGRRRRPCARCSSSTARIPRARAATRNMDPLGFASRISMRSASGARRTATSPIDASGVLLDGTKVDGPAALRGALLQQKDQFVKAVTSKLLMYALGREIDYHDAPAIRAIVRAAAADDYRWSSTILAIVKSTPFQMSGDRSHDRDQKSDFPAHRASGHRRRRVACRCSTR